MLTDQAREWGTFRREHLRMVRIEANYREVVVGRTRLGRPKKERVCEVTAYLRFEGTPDIDYVQVNGTPHTFYDSGDDMQLILPPVLLTVS